MKIKDPIGFSVFLTVLLFSSWYIHMGLSTNDASRYSLTKAIVTKGTFCVDGVLDELIGRERAVDRSKFRGKTYSDKAPLGSFIGVIPAYFIHKILPKKEHKPFRIWFVTLFMASLPAAFTAFIFYKLALLYDTSKPLAAFLGISVILGTNLYFWSVLMFSESLTTSLFIAAFYYLKGHHKHKLFLSGLFAGLAVSSAYYVFLFLPIFFIYIIYLHKKKAMFFILGAFLAGLIPMSYHYSIYGNPFTLPYSYQENFGAYHNKGLYGAQTFSFQRLINILFSKDFGLFFYNPILFISLYFIPAFFKKHKKDSFFIGALILTLLVFDSCLSLIDTDGFGFGWGARHLAPIFPLFFLFFTQIEKKHVVWFFSISAFSILLNFYIVNLLILPPIGESLKCLKDYHTLGYAGGFSSLAQYLFFTNNAQPYLMAFLNLSLVITTGILWYYLIRTFKRNHKNSDSDSPALE